MELRPFYLGQAWQRLGHRVRIVGASQSHVRSHQPAVAGSISRQEEEGLEYYWLKTPRYAGSGVGRVANMAVFVAQLTRYADKVVADFKPDAVIASSTYPLDIYPASRIARRHEARLCFEVHDLWPLSPIELGGYSRWHPFIVTMQAAENYAYRRADVVVSMLPKAEEHMRRHGLAPGKFVHVPNGIDVREWTREPENLPEALSSDLARIRAAGRLIVCYAGGHGLSNALDPVLEAAKLTIQDPITYVFVGQGPEKPALRDKAARLGLNNVHFHDPVPKRAVPTLLAQSDILIMSWRQQALYRFGISPNKLMDYMMSAKPIVMAVEAGNDIIGDAGCGITVRPQDPIAMAQAIRKLVALPVDERRDIGARGQRYVIERHNYDILARTFLTGLAGKR
jgi:glycosyltransferase involved in cell wall biosynthesis